jgi:hypothetical protein
VLASEECENVEQGLFYKSWLLGSQWDMRVRILILVSSSVFATSHGKPVCRLI